MTAMKRIAIAGLAVVLLVGSLLMQKIARAASDGGSGKNYQESSDLGPMPVGGSSQSSRDAGSSERSENTAETRSMQEPTEEQLQKRQKIIVY